MASIDEASTVFMDWLRRLGDGHTDAYEAIKGNAFETDEYELWVLAVVSVLVILLGSLAAGAGIGGGGLFVPLYAFVLGVGAKAAVPLSKATILGGAIGNMMTIAFARHPDPKKNKPLIDYEASTFMQSGELLGVIFGVLLNLILPELLIIIFLAVLLSFNAYKTLKKGVSKYKEETRKANETKNALEPKSVADGASGSELEITPNTQQISGTEPEITPKMQKILDEDAKQFPLWAWALLTPMTVYTILYAIVKQEIGTCNPVAYWLWYFSPVPVLGLAMLVTAMILKRRHRNRVEAGFVFKGDGEDNPEYRDLKWTSETLKQYPAIAVLAGVAAGLLGIGGGMVIGPLFIQLDMQPKVGSSSCAFMIFWTAISGVVQYYLAGKVGWEFIVLCVSIGLVSGQLGQTGVDRMLKKSGRPSYVIFLLGTIVLVACVAMTGTGIYKLIQAISESANVLEFDTYDFQCHNQ